MPVMFTLFIIRDNGIVRKFKINVSDRNAERLLAEDAALVEEMVYFVNSSLGHYNWDYVQVIASDGGHLKNYTNPKRLAEDYVHPKLNLRMLSYLRPSM